MLKHNGIYCFTCTHCEKGFTTKRSLQMHLKIHSGEKTSICDVCGKRYALNTREPGALFRPFISHRYKVGFQKTRLHISYTLSEAWSGVNLADLMAAQGAFGTDFYDRSSRTIVGTMLWTEYRPVLKIGPKGALGSHEIRPIHSAPSLGQSKG